MPVRRSRTQRPSSNGRTLDVIARVSVVLHHPERIPARHRVAGTLPIAPDLETRKLQQLRRHGNSTQLQLLEDIPRRGPRPVTPRLAAQTHPHRSTPALQNCRFMPIRWQIFRSAASDDR
jgi:hypothetical protein